MPSTRSWSENADARCARIRRCAPSAGLWTRYGSAGTAASSGGTSLATSCSTRFAAAVVTHGIAHEMVRSGSVSSKMHAASTPVSWFNVIATASACCRPGRCRCRLVGAVSSSSWMRACAGGRSPAVRRALVWSRRSRAASSAAISSAAVSNSWPSPVCGTNAAWLSAASGASRHPRGWGSPGASVSANHIRQVRPRWSTVSWTNPGAS